MRITAIVILFLLTATKSVFSQNIYINEVSQGESGSREYVEFIVVGEPNCTNQQPCLDLRGVVFDDNDGSFGPSGVAPGAMRFANTNFWSCIAVGTIIVVYNNDSRNASLPSNDLSSTDGNFTLVIPGNSNLFERHATLPSSSNFNYSTTGWVNNGNWNAVSMNNGGDLMQIRQNASSTSALNSVGYGSITATTNIYFAGTHGGKVISMKNTTNNDPTLQANWASEDAPARETPGQPNTPANAAWINALRNGTATNNVTVTSSKIDTGCGANCTGSINITPYGGAAPYTYVWNNNATSQNLSNLCAGTYEVEVTDALGCSQTESVTIVSNGATITIAETIVNESCDNSCDGSITTAISGGTAPYTYSWNNGSSNANLSNVCDGTYNLIVTDNAGCSTTKAITVAAGLVVATPTITPVANMTINANPVTLTADTPNGTWAGSGVVNNTFNPTIAGVGTHQICYTVGTANCSETACITIIVTEGCVEENYNEAITTCPGQAINYDGQQIQEPGNYSFTFQNIEGCDSIVNLNFSYHVLNPYTGTIAICLGDSTDVNGVFYTDAQIVYYETTDNNGCIVQNSVTINVTDCNIPPYSVFVPNTFTPNGDFVNETFPIIIEGGELLEGYIFNRWGQVVKEFNLNDLEWNGQTQSGQDAPDGVYTYSFIVRKTGGVTEKFTGFVTLIR